MLKSKTVWTGIAMVGLNLFQAYSPLIPQNVLNYVNPALGVLTIIFRAMQTQDLSTPKQ